MVYFDLNSVLSGSWKFHGSLSKYFQSFVNCQSAWFKELADWVRLPFSNQYRRRGDDNTRGDVRSIDFIPVTIADFIITSKWAIIFLHLKFDQNLNFDAKQFPDQNFCRILNFQPKYNEKRQIWTLFNFFENNYWESYAKLCHFSWFKSGRHFGWKFKFVLQNSCTKLLVKFSMS